MKPSTLKGEYLVSHIYDIFQGIGKEINIDLRFTKFEGLSQIIISNNIYLIGSGLNKSNSKNSFISSHLLRIDFNEEFTPQIKIFTSSEFPHYMPSLAVYKNEEIYVIGGKNNITCEVFSLKSNKWKKLKNLPSERFGCSVICENSTKTLYLFGGTNNSTNTINLSVLKYNLKVNLEWETLIVTSNSNFLQRTFAGSFISKNGTIILLGGSTNVYSETDDIIEYNINSKSATNLSFKLSRPAVFNSSAYFEGDEINSIFYGYDSENLIHKIDLMQKFASGLSNNDYLISDDGRY
jgi:N-acetylneuraminic acid mutarotase